MTIKGTLSSFDMINNRSLILKMKSTIKIIRRGDISE